jgi:hypothetical protein
VPALPQLRGTDACSIWGEEPQSLSLLPLVKAHRLAACKRQMRPVGLAMKKSRKKYGDTARGELMLIHQCEECGKLSINRIAADDIAERIYEILDGASGLSVDTHHQLKQNGIQPLELEDAAVVKNRLFGIKGIRK